MRAYPRWYRRERGLELMTTLLDDAAAGQRRPRWTDIVDLIGGGVLARLRPPRGVLPGFVILLVALSMAVVVSGAAVLASPYPGPPTEAQAIAVGSIATDLPVHNLPGPVLDCHEGSCDQPQSGDDVVAYDEAPMRTANTVVHYQVPRTQGATVVKRARERLSSAGWQVAADSVDFDTEGFSAAKDGLNVTLYTAVTPSDSANTDLVQMYVSKRVSAATVTAVIAAVVIGSVAGWMIGVWAMQRFKRHQRSRRRDIRDAAVPFLLGAAMMISSTIAFITIDWSDGISPEDVQAPLVFILFWWPITIVLAISALYGLVALWLSTRPDQTHETPPRRQSSASQVSI